MRTIKMLILGALVLSAVPAAAQDPDKKVNFNIGGGYTFTAGEVRNHLGDGYNVNFGMTVNATPVVGIQVEYSFNGLGEKEIRLPVSGAPGEPATDQSFFASMNMHYVDLNLVFRVPTEGKVKPYLLVGGGWYYRPVQVTTPSVGYVPGWCDPWWYVCYPGGFVPVDKIVGERSSNDIGMTIGAGLNVALGESASFYLETKYHYIWGPTIKNPTTNSETKANGQFLPITAGIRF